VLKFASSARGDYNALVRHLFWNSLSVMIGFPASSHCVERSPAASLAKARMLVALSALAGLLLPQAVTAAEVAAGVIMYQQIDATTFRYTIDLNNIGSTNVGTLWYSWVPGQDFLAASPTNVVGPTGWTDTVTQEFVGDGFGIQWVNTATPLASGNRLFGFRFDSTSTPAQLGANSTVHTTFPAGTSFIYAGAPLTDAGFQFTIAPTTTPWTNPFNANDVDNNGRVNAQDALLVIHELLLHGNETLATPTLDDKFPNFVDVNGTNSLSARDALLVIADLLNLPTTVSPVQVSPLAVAAPMAMANVPEPGTLWLALISAVGFAAVAARRQARSSKAA